MPKQKKPKETPKQQAERFAAEVARMVAVGAVIRPVEPGATTEATPEDETSPTERPVVEKQT